MGKAILTPTQRVNRLWRKVDREYGANGAPPPSFSTPKSLSASGASATTDSTGHIEIGRGLARQLTSRKPSVRRDARFQMLHEFAHSNNFALGESGANHKANKVSRRLNKQQAKRQALAARSGKRKG